MIDTQVLYINVLYTNNNVCSNLKNLWSLLEVNTHVINLKQL
jgi:hypothetical protein